MRKQLAGVLVVVAGMLGAGTAQAQVAPGPQSMWFGEINVGVPDQQAYLSLVNGQVHAQCFTVSVFTETAPATQYVWCENHGRQRIVIPLHLVLNPGHYAVLVQAYGLVGASVALRPTSDPFGARAQILYPDRQDTPLQ